MFAKNIKMLLVKSWNTVGVNSTDVSIGLPIGTTSYEDLLEEDQRRGKRNRDEEDEWEREPCIILNKARIKSIKVSSLGPVLKRRFIHPGGE